MATKRQINRMRRRRRRPHRAKNVKPAVCRNIMIPIRKGRPFLEVRMSDEVAKGLVGLVEGDRRHECGALLIGTTCVDRITGNKIVFVTDMYSDHLYGGSSEYTFTTELQTKAICYIREKYGMSARVVGTMHSHGMFPAFFSSVDDRMMRSHGSDQVHIVISPSSSKYVLTMFGSDEKYHHEVELNMSNIRDIFRYQRRQVDV